MREPEDMNGWMREIEFEISALEGHGYMCVLAF
jgi:hypothetical protein